MVFERCHNACRKLMVLALVRHGIAICDKVHDPLAHDYWQRI
jgi:hypothetical protein